MADPSTYRPAPGSIPTSPGVYRFRDEHRRVVYVGKAKNLRARLTSYFQDIVNLHPRTATMVTSAASVEWTVVNTEVEALQLEYSWIKEFDPRFNVKYRDDKSYPWLAVTLNEEFPRVMVGRGAKKRGVRYFGPYSHAWAIRETVDLLLRVFPMRSCSNGVFKRSAQIGRPCLLGYIGKCSAPCVGRVSAEEHREIVDDFCDFMGGQTDGVRQAPREGDVRRVRRPWTTSGPPGCATTSAPSTGRWRSSRWCSATAPTPTWSRSSEDPLEVAVQIFYVRGGRIRGQRGWVADKVDDADTGGLVERFLLQLYDGELGDSIPREVLVPGAARGHPGPGAVAERPARAPGSRSGSRSAATRRRCRRPSPATRSQALGAAQDQAGQRPDHPQPGARGDPGRRSSCPRRRCASSATTSRTCRAPRWSPRWWSSRTAWPARASTAAS